jgi:hypothetical protein
VTIKDVALSEQMRAQEVELLLQHLVLVERFLRDFVCCPTVFTGNAATSDAFSLIVER